MAKVQIEKPRSSYFYPWPLCLVTAAEPQGRGNIITIGASSVCSSTPPTVGIAVKPQRYSYELIMEACDFGVNLPGPDLVEPSDLCGTISGRDVDKFAEAGLTPQEAQTISAPLIKECPVSIECTLTDSISLGSHDWIIGEMVAVSVDEDLLDEDGRFDPPAERAIFCFGGDYRSVGEKLADWFFTART
jgi:flavin reductase (DIM6/NTAB) family NADH-FMN oxidoreductase RutF